ncbi:MAG: hypothetical protein A2915_00680 [Candidatus Yanofskybacteria bacterium RIFCSPLOWO2_01_FULL_41_34]|uniref:Uncharacterized protein n=1 Tax=Candidatus Yanofskybacteria bacterium RIFCSPHIGHO2_01_FULL_41_26 TaxID=1802661 RepID=A0A1F8EC34_9BACT|nr:MAG: hypothetical protein A2649_02710 [Candidatus Yanofskybacteria bacterium RIFCSPHIGHO2_01_FULL_41_26]OGN22412.1 MAG: hypothetical protein A2915_00680 [Candidatus Yanofskybacteria bacterium RIFCSPLOWO2_01_FULL_41_34]
MKYKNFYKKLVEYSRDVLAGILILWGIISLLTPFTPGSWLFFVGLFIIFGRKRTQNKLARIIGKKWFNKLKIKKILGKIPTKIDNKP